MPCVITVPINENGVIFDPDMNDVGLGAVRTEADSVPKDETLALNRGKPLQALIHGFALTRRERTDLIAFLRSLTDESFLTNPALVDPHAGR
jgi:hypothetical protein